MTSPQGPRTRVRALVIVLATAWVVLAGTAALAQEQGPVAAADGPIELAAAEGDEGEGEEESEIDPAVAEELREGAAVYTSLCSSCHQPGGAGLTGQFPPLINNPHVEDASYVAEVINNGRRGEIVLDGVTYDGVMPAFSTLSEAETDAVIAYIQNGFVAPPDESAAPFPAGPVAGTELPALSNYGAWVAYLLAAAVAAMVLAPRVISQNSRLNTPWLDAWLKTAVIVLGVVLLTMFVPDWALKTEAVGKLSRPAQDFIGVTLWGGGLAVVIGAMWYAHRESRI
ncbi:MAG: cytochrome c [Acidimicrobiales bacterium]|nr:cytochrome c [Acidimicrobiales bacterium]